MNKTYDKISEWADKLAQRIIEVKFLDIEEIRTVLSVHLAMAMKECMEIQISDTRRKINQLKIKIANCQGVNQREFQAELTELKERAIEELRVINATSPIIRKDEKFRMLSLVVYEKFGGDVLEELKTKVKLKMNGFTENKNGENLPENAYQRGIKDLKQELKSKFEKEGLTDALHILETC